MNSQYIMDIIGLILGGILWRGLVPYLETHANAKQIAQIEGIAKRAVQATELLLPKETSRAKLLHALDVVAQQGQRFGLNLNAEEWEAYIQAAVKNLKDADQEIKKDAE